MESDGKPCEECIFGKVLQSTLHGVDRGFQSNVKFGCRERHRGLKYSTEIEGTQRKIGTLSPATVFLHQITVLYYSITFLRSPYLVDPKSIWYCVKEIKVTLQYLPVKYCCDAPIYQRTTRSAYIRKYVYLGPYYNQPLFYPYLLCC